ncbi:MAG: hypothetical protein V1873_02665, partial [Verrucomicrobiota bacterium]
PPAAAATPAASAALPPGEFPPLAPPQRKPWTAVSTDQVGLQKTKIFPSADTCVMIKPPGSREMNGGAAKELTLKGNDSVALTRYDVGAVRGWTITRATWRGKVLRGRARSLGFSTITMPWEEGSGTLKEPATSGATYSWANAKTKPWGMEGAPAPYALRGNGQSLMCVGMPTTEQTSTDEWVSVPVDPAVVQALVCGASHGIAITDEKGQLEAPVVIASREDKDNSYFIELDGGIMDMTPPSRVTNLKAWAHPGLQRRSSVGALLTWTAGGDEGKNGQAFRYEIRYGLAPTTFERATEMQDCRCPWPQPSGQNDQVIIEDLEPDTTYSFFVSAMDEAGQASASSEITLKTPPPLHLPESQAPTTLESGTIDVAAGALGFFVVDEAAGIDPLSGAVTDRPQPAQLTAPTESYLWDRTTRTLHLRAAQNETVGFLIGLQRKGAEFPPLKISLEPFQNPKNKLESKGLRFSRTWYSYAPSKKSGTVWRGDALLAFEDRLSFLSPSNPVPNPAFQSVYAEIHVPPETAAGTYRSAMTLARDDGTATKMNVRLDVLPIRLPERPRFTMELVVPSLVALLYKKDLVNKSDAFPVELQYQRLARAHRCALAFMPYLRNGTCSQAFLPTSRGKGVDWSVSTWDSWDQRTGPYLSGEAFGGMDQRALPVSHIILPTFENWPTPFGSTYLCAEKEETPSSAPAGLKVYAGPSEDIYSCMSADYWRGLRAAISQFGQHFTSKGWQTTAAHFWLTDGPAPNYQGKAPPWSFGEPVYRDDFLALEQFAQVAVASASSWSPSQFVFRVNIPDASLLAGYGQDRFSLLSVFDPAPVAWKCLRERSAVFGAKLWLQGDALPLEDTTLEIQTTALKYFLEGADGWGLREVTGRPEHWTRPQSSSLLYCGMPAGITGPLPSLRLKALRRAEQDIEYLLLLQDKMKWTREQLRDFAVQRLPALADAPSLSCDELYLLRYTVQELLK